MSVVAPPEPPRPDELELLIREARARRRKRWLGGTVAVAVFAGGTLVVLSIANGGQSGVSHAGPGSTAIRSTKECGIRVLGPRILDSAGSLVYREPVPKGEVNANRIPSQVRCSGSAVWVVFFNGVGMMHEDYVGVRSLDRGRTWRIAFAQSPGAHSRYGDSAEPGPWTLAGARGGYFVGSCPACSEGKAFGLVSLSVTKNGGRTFRTYPVPALSGFEPLGVRVTGGVVRIAARRLVRKIDSAPFEIYKRKTVTVRVK
jgi:hypothetical protein